MMHEALLSGDPVKVAIEVYGYSGDSMFGAFEQKQLLLSLLDSNPSIRNQTIWVGEKTWERFYDRSYMIDGLPSRMKESDWQAIGRAAIASSLARQSGVAEAASATLPPFPEYWNAQKDFSVEQALQAWDPTHSAYIRDLFRPDHPLVRAAREVQELTAHEPKIDSDTLVKQFKRDFLEPPGDGEEWAPYWGQWTPTETRLALSIGEYLRPAGAMETTPIGGEIPKKEAWLAARWARTDALPDLATAATATFKLTDLNGSNSQYHTNTIAVAPPAGMNVAPKTMPIVALQGRAATGIRVFDEVTGADVTEQLGIQFERLGSTWGYGENGAAPGIRMITPERVSAEVQRRLEGWAASQARLAQNARGPQLLAENLRIELDILHPDFQPAPGTGGKNWYMNQWYSGTAHVSPEMDSIPSLHAALYVGPGGLNRLIQQTGLQAQKKGMFALQWGPRVSPAELELIESNWAEDLGGVLQAKSAKLMELLSGKKETTIPPIFYNAVLETFRRSTFVRGVSKESGQPVLWTAEQVVAWQNANPGQSILEALDNAELYKPSERKIRDLYGDAGRYSSRDNLDELGRFGARSAKTFDGSFSKRELAAIKGGLTIDKKTGKWQTRKIWESSEAKTPAISVYTPRPPQSPIGAQRAMAHIAHRQAQNSDIRGARIEYSRMNYATLRTQVLNEVRSLFDRSRATLQLDTTAVPERPVGMDRREQQHLDALARFQQLTDSAHGMAWRVNGPYLDSPAPNTPDEGTQTLGTLQQPPHQRALHVAPGDLTLVNVDTFQRTNGTFDETAFQAVTRELIATGASIALYSPLNQPDALTFASEYLRETPGYRPLPGSRYFFEEIRDPSRPATVEASESTLMEQSEINFDNMLILLNEVEYLHGEQGAFLADGESRGSGGAATLPTNILEALPYPDFAIPATPDSIEYAKTAIRELFADPVALAAFEKASGIPSRATSRRRKDWERAKAELLRRWDNPHESTDGMFPTDFRYRGAIIPLVRPAGQTYEIVLYRDGMKTLDYKSELPKALRKARETSGDVAPIVMAAPKDQGSNLTFNEGQIQAVRRDAQHGFRVDLRVPLDRLGGKWQLEFAGFKIVLSPPSSSIPKAVGKFLGIGHHAHISSDDVDSKNSWLGQVGNFRNLFAVHGTNFLPDLTEFFTGTRAQEGMTADQAKQYSASESSTEQLLTRLSRNLETLPLADLQAMHRTGIPSDRFIQALQAAHPDSAEWIAKLQRFTRWPEKYQAMTPAEQREQATTAVGFATLLYLAGGPASIRGEAPFRHVASSTGLREGKQDSRLRGQYMPRLFTEFFDSLPTTHPARTRILDRVNAQSPDSWVYDENLYMNIRAEDGSWRRARVQMGELFTSGDNPAMDAASHESGSSQKLSDTAEAILNMSFGAGIAYENQLREFKKVLTQEGITQLESAEDVWELFNQRLTLPDLREDLARGYRSPSYAPYLGLAGEMGSRFRERLDFSRDKETLSATEYEAAVQQFNQAQSRVLKALNLKPEQDRLIHTFIRQQLGAPAARSEADRAVHIHEATEALDSIELTISEGFLPTANAAVPMMHYADLAILYMASRDGHGLVLREEMHEGSVPIDISNWEAWLDIALSFAAPKQAKFDPHFLLATDHMLHSYIGQETSLANLPVSVSKLRRSELWDEDVQELAVSLAPDVRAQINDPMVINGNLETFAARFGMVRHGSTWVGQNERASFQSRRARGLHQYRMERGMALPNARTVRNLREEGRTWRERETRDTALTRMAIDLRFSTAMINPALYIASFLELGQRHFVEKATNILLGTSTRGLAAQVEAAIKDKTGVGSTPYTSTQLRRLVSMQRDLGSRKEFRNELLGEVRFYQESLITPSRAERGTRALAKFANKWADPLSAMPGSFLAQHYVEAILDYVRDHPSQQMTTEQVMGELQRNPMWFRDNMGDAHKAAIARLSKVRSTSKNPLSLALNGIIDPMRASSNGIVRAMGGWMGHIPLIFAGYGSNVLIQNTGMQGANALLATFLDGRKKWGWVSAAQNKLAGDGFVADPDATLDLSAVLESADLQKAFAQSAVTHTSMFFLASLLGGVGLFGEDDEERRLKYLDQQSRGVRQYDPRELVNDWRNRDMLFFDDLPFNLGRLFDLGGEDGEEVDAAKSRAMQQMHWMLKQFVSPLQGISKAVSTGDFRYVTWGFQDAIGSMPLINASTWYDANVIVAQLIAQAPEDTADETAAMTTLNFFTRAVAAYESMLFESAFVNQIYAAIDEYDRDPWVLTEPDPETGRAVRDRLDIPQKTSVLEEHLDENGDPALHTKSRDWWSATMHGLTENRATLALFMSLVTGEPKNSSYWRQNMAAKTVKIDKQALDEGQAASLVMAAYKQAAGEDSQFTDTEGEVSALMSQFDEHGQEMLTSEGAEAVIRGLWKGTVQYGSPALQGVYIPKEMRYTLQEKFMEQLMQEGIDMGLDAKGAEKRMKAVWYGPYDDPEVIGLRDIIWADNELIPLYPSEHYRQLNTTYITGPDGYMHAVGVTRTALKNAFGFAPFTPVYSAATGDSPADGRFNTIDPVAGLNTGRRGLEKVHSSERLDRDEIEKGEKEALAKAANKDYEPSDTYAGYGNTRGGGGGYSRGGGGYRGSSWSSGGYSFPRLNMPTRDNPTYGSNDPYLRDSNPAIRRANVNRQRFSSTRGRLNQWQ